VLRWACLLSTPAVGLFFPAPAVAQYQAPSDRLIMTAAAADTWTAGDTDILQLEGPVAIEFDRATLSAERAVVWISPEPGAEANRQRVQVALIGQAKVTQQGAVRTGDRILVNGSVAGRIRLTANARNERDRSTSELYQVAEQTRNPRPAAPTVPPATVPATQPAVATPFPTPATVPSTTAPTTWPAVAPWTPRPPVVPVPATQPGTSVAATQPAAVPMPATPVQFDAPSLELVQTDDGTVAAVLSKGVRLIHRRPNGDLLEVQASRAVLFTPLTDLRKIQTGGIGQIQDAITSAYLEDDVRLVFTPASMVGEQRLEARRVYYEFATDRAILTDAILRTVDAKAGIPIRVRADTIRQLARGEYRTEGAELSTSAFATPTYSLRAERVYIRQEQPATGPAPAATDSGSPPAGPTLVDARNTTFRIFGVPFFYLPRVGANLSDQQSALRSIGFEHSQQFGTGILTEWGLFETLGMTPPKDLDATYRLDYFSDRGPAGGVSARYQGGDVTEGSRQPWNFEGDFRSYFVYDHGFDDIGRPTPRPPEGENFDSRIRGHALWQHQHILPDNWQMQLRAGYVSDQLFLEQWFPRDFDRELPHDVSAYLKRQENTEAFTLLAQFQPNGVVTTSDLLQEQFEVERLPEIGYRRIGEDVGGVATFFSENTVAGLHFQTTRYSLAEQGFFPPSITPGLPSLGTTGITDDTIWRGDFRQEIAFPMQAGPFKVVPYLVGRYTAYTDSPEDGTIHRLFGAVGARVTTAFWKVDDLAKSELFDINRLRHVIEPELNVFTAGTTEDRSNVYVFDERVDSINDVSALQFGVRQRWQTYRGGPGRWRSVDFLTLNVEAVLFANQPDESIRNPIGFRGAFFPTMPETSLPRNAINADLTWRIADTTAVLADVSWNADRSSLATASVGLVAQRDERTSYYIGTRYIEALNSNITTVAVDYQLNSKYNFSFAQAFDFGQGENVVSSIGIVRKFDTLFLIIRAFHNETTEQSGISFSLTPRWLRAGADTDVLNSALQNQRR
jgi:hypothetical protein